MEYRLWNGVGMLIVGVAWCWLVLDGVGWCWMVLVSVG